MPTETDILIDQLAARYRELVARGHEDGFTPPVLRLALEIDEDENFTTQAIEEAIQALAQRGLEKRARHMASYLGDCDPARNKAALEALTESLARGGDGKPVPFAVYKERVERVYYGFVFTAHPTFALTQNMTRQLAQQAAGHAGSPAHKPDPQLLEAAATEPFHTPTLDEENEFALEAIGHAKNGIDALHEAALKTGRKHYPQEWTALRPRLATVASWVGFDLDGRKDIGWPVIFGKRITVQVRQLENYRERIAAIITRYKDAGDKLSALLGKLDDTIAIMNSAGAFFENYSAASDPEAKKLQDQSRLLVRSAGERITHPDNIAAPLETLLAQSTDDDLRQELVQLLASLRTCGIAQAEIHVRINATQLHNALKRQIPLKTHPNEDGYRTEYLQHLKELIAGTEVNHVNMGDLLKEKTTARQQFILMQQMIKHIDGASPIRFLIAETESAFTILSALYFAKRFGVDKHIDICPLFETSDALKNGTEFFETLLEIPEFRDYIRKRGRLCIQTGYSDAGRLIGQGPATGSIERLKERMARLFETHGLAGTDLLFFDTHGESVGRGGHPISMEKRMEYICPPHVRNMMEQRDIHYIQESSFQGGDGYSWFMTPDTALAVLTRIMGYWLHDAPDASQDPYYSEKDGVNSIFNRVKAMQTRLMEDPYYSTLLTAFGPNLMHGTGSRAIKRQKDTAEAKPVTSARDMRAIPHNGVLEQMGLLANTVAGMGGAIRRNGALFEKLMRESPRFRTILELTQRGYALSDPLVMKAYIDTLDPQTWLLRQYNSDNGRLADTFAHVARQLRHMGLHTPVKDVFEDIFGDYVLLQKADGAFSAGMQREEDGPCHNMPDELACLHAIRLALIHRIFQLAIQIPRFSPGHEVTREEVLQKIFQLDIDSAVGNLRRIFPKQSAVAKGADFGEPSDYSADTDYAEEHRRLFDPLEKLGHDVRDISTAIAQHYGFIG